MVVLILDSSVEPGRGDEYIKDFLVANKTEFIVALNKWDLVNKEFKSLRLDQYRKVFGTSKNFQIVSASEGDGCSESVSYTHLTLPTTPYV